MMTKILLNLAVVFTVLCVSCEAAAQSDVALATRKAELQALSVKLKKRDENDRRQVQEFARRAGIPVRRELPNGRVLELQRISPDIGPVFYITNNVDAADTVSTDEVWPGGSAALDLDGNGMIVGEWDGGAIFAEHPDFTGRLTQVDSPPSVSNHSTHVAGTLIGSGEWLVPGSRGMAYGAHLNAYDWISDTAEMAAAASNGLLVSNHSYGIAAGWLYTADPTPPDTWWWIGGVDPAIVEDSNFGYYDSEAQLWDQIAFNAPYYLIVKASGNDRTDIGPSPGEEYTIIDQDGNFVDTSTSPRQADCAPAGYDCLPTHSVAKNVLTVGAVDDLIGGYSPFSGPSSVQMADFSSWGPTDDGRIKPDVVGNGMFLLSAWADSPYYAAGAGTSMATPNVTGSLLLLQQHYENISGSDNFMRAATLKALAIHTADEAGDADGPDYAFGWGLLNTKTAARVISQNGGAHQIIEDSLPDGEVNTVEISVTEADAIISATLVWADPPPAILAAPTLDPPDLMLVNDLDLRIKRGPSTYLPWVLNPASPATAATTGDNFRDNVEQVVIDSVGTGSYFVEVSHKGTLLNNDSQAYSLIISVTPALPTNSGLLIDENFSGGLPTGWSVDTITGIDWTINTPAPGDSRLDNLTGGTGNFAMVDNDYSHQTVTSLRTPTFDLSSNTAVVLRFKSSFYMDTAESINVDISTDGGTGWSNVWKHQGFNPFPTLYPLDLSGAAAGQASVMFRFRFDSEGDIQGDLWQIDDVELEVFGGGPLSVDPPGLAANPNPANGSSGLGLNSNLSWSAGSLATSHDVYFGTSPDFQSFQGNQGGTTFDPGTLAYFTTYYWRIDEVNADGTTTGDLWSFTTEAPPLVLPGVASNPFPNDSANDVSAAALLSWTAGSDADSHNIYFGTNPSPGFQGSQGGTSLSPGTLAGATTYYWRIDEVNADGTTTGDLWSFTTEALPLELPAVASNPLPDDSTNDVSVDANISWTADSNADSHNVYFGTSPSPGFQVSQSGTSFDPGTLTNSTTYYWKVDEVNGAGSTTGPVWSFTTGTAPAFHIASVSVADVLDKGPRRHGMATVTVYDAGASPISGVAVSGTFSGDWNGTGSDITDVNGQIVVETPPVKNGSSWQFCVDTANMAGWDFNQTINPGLLCNAPATAGSIVGSVTDSGGVPIQGASASADTGQSGSTDAAGNYTLSDVPTGTRTVMVSASTYDPASKQAPVSNGAASTLDFSLTATPTGGGTGTIKGTVTDSSGTKLRGVEVQVLGGPSATTNKRGKYTIRNVAAGLRSVTASMTGFVGSPEFVTITAGSTATLDFSLTPDP